MKAPWFKLWAEQTLRSMRWLTPGQRGYLFTLMCEAWLSEPRGHLPINREMIWKLAGAESKKKFEAACGPILELFELADESYCYRLLADQDGELRQLSQSRSEAGKSGARRRWQADGNQEPSVKGNTKQADGKHMASAIELPRQKIADLDLDLELDREKDKDTNTAPLALAPGGAVSVGCSRFMDIWNTNCGTLAQVIQITRDREKKLRGKLKANPDFDQQFCAAVKVAASTPFLCGESERGWRADFDWLIDNCDRVLEGSYAQASSKRKNGAAFHSSDNSRFKDRKPDFVME